jgi:uncharacterized membrane protein YeaQ/YmgE (transglycosylase-associated protein family)
MRAGYAFCCWDMQKRKAGWPEVCHVTEGAMEGQSLIVFLIIGLIAGWLAGQIMKGSGYGLIGDLIVGVIGAFIGGWLWRVLHLPGLGPWWLTAIVSAVIGACILLFLLRLIKR